MLVNRLVLVINTYATSDFEGELKRFIEPPSSVCYIYSDRDRRVKSEIS